MDWDEPKTKSPKIITLGEDLSKVSLSELAERVAALQAEIARVVEAPECHDALRPDGLGQRHAGRGRSGPRATKGS